MVIFVYYSFKVDVDRQDKLLYEIQQTQNIGNSNSRKLIELEESNNELKDANKKLVKTVCILQEQILSLGAKPIVPDESNCITGIISK
jgi:hypothetical protein